MRLTITDTPEQATALAAARIERLIEQPRPAGARLHIALAGGSTPRAVYTRLAAEVGDWSGVELWFGDERAVAPDDPRSNYRLVRETLLAGSRGTPPQVHRIAGEEEPEQAARAYAAELSDELPRDEHGVPQLDLALLGLGEDGHTASLFPNQPVLLSRDSLCAAVVGPKPPPQRVTMTLPLLRGARSAIVLAIGVEKRHAVVATLAGPSQSTPASLLNRARTELIVDRAAAPPEPARPPTDSR